MTKFILVGGYIQKATDGGKAFAEAVVDGFDQPVRILVCAFARPHDAWEETLQNDKQFFTSMLRVKTLLTLATPENFLEQLDKTDAVYFKGGRTCELISVLEKCTGWEKKLKGKTVAGSSAGVNFLAKHYYSLDELKAYDGLGILPIKALVHYRSDYNAPNIDWNKAHHELQNSGDEELEILRLREGEFKIIEQ